MWCMQHMPGMVEGECWLGLEEGEGTALACLGISEKEVAEESAMQCLQHVLGKVGGECWPGLKVGGGCTRLPGD